MPLVKPWEVWEEEDCIHVVPVKDLIAHETATFGDCACGPAQEWDGDMAMPMFVHFSLDGREANE